MEHTMLQAYKMRDVTDELIKENKYNGLTRNQMEQKWMER